MLQDRRLIKRYCATNPVFLALFLRDFVVVNFRKVMSVALKTGGIK